MTIFFHIGTPKTGTTALQRFLAANRETLAELGYDFPSFLGEENHAKLAAYALEPSRDVGLKIEMKLTDEDARQEFNATLERDFEEAVSAKGDYIFSSEHCTTYLAEESELSRLKSLVTATGQDVRLIVYFREPVSYLVSRFSTNLKQGRTNTIRVPPGKNLDRWYDYPMIVDLWSKVFGRDSLTIRLFSKDHLKSGDIRHDFCQVLGLQESALDFGYATDPMANRSVDYLVGSFLLEMNRLVPRYVDQRINPLRGELAVLCEVVSNREGILVPEDIVTQMNDLLRDPMARFNRDYLGGPFASPFAPYSPEGKCAMRRLTRKEYMEIFADIWTAKIAMEKSIDLSALSAVHADAAMQKVRSGSRNGDRVLV
ncbi:MAG: hypothetical protein RIC87_05705 [Kiloniellales bacterium]